MAEWPTVRLPKEMMERVESFANSQYAKQNGFTSKSQVIVAAVRDFLTKYSKSHIRIINSSVNRITIMDDRFEAPIFVEIKNKKVHCSEDGVLSNKKPCVHMVISLYKTEFLKTIKKNKILSDFGDEHNEENIETAKVFMKFYSDDNSDDVEFVLELKERSEKFNETKEMKTK